MCVSSVKVKLKNYMKPEIAVLLILCTKTYVYMLILLSLEYNKRVSRPEKDEKPLLPLIRVGLLQLFYSLHRKQPMKKPSLINWLHITYTILKKVWPPILGTI